MTYITCSVFTRQIIVRAFCSKTLSKPKASEVLTSYLQQLNYPPWTSYFVKYSSIINDQKGMSHFNWQIGKHNYHILRTGCYPYIKYHCTRRPYADLTVEDNFFRIIKILNLGMLFGSTQSRGVCSTGIMNGISSILGIPCLAYGIAAIFLIRHEEVVYTTNGLVKIYFLYEEDKGSLY